MGTTDWREHSYLDGRSYFYNIKTKVSQWQMPEEIKCARLNLESEKVLNNNQGEKKITLVKKKKISKEEGRKIFKQMLVDFGISWKNTWENTVKLIINDHRYNNVVKSIKERKAIFVEWSKQKESEEREKKYKHQLQAHKELLKLLDQTEALKDIRKFSEAEIFFGKAPRWNAIQDIQERKKIFFEYISEKLLKETANLMRKNKNKILLLKKYLLSCKWLNSATEWSKVCNKLDSVNEFKDCPKLDRLKVFKEVIRINEENEKALLEKKEKETINKERKHRDKFKSIIRLAAKNNIIRPKMRWKDFVPIIEKEEAYRCICSNLSGSLPSSLFKDLVESQEYKLEKDKELVFQAIQVSKIIIDNNIKYETYKSILIYGLENAITNKKSPYLKKINVNFNKILLKISEVNTRLCYDELKNTFAKKKLIELERSKILFQKFTSLVIELTHQKKNGYRFG